MKSFAYLILVGILSLAFAQNIFSQTASRKPAEKQLGMAWQEYQKAAQAARSGDSKNAEKFYLAALETARKNKDKSAEGIVAFYLADFYQNFRRLQKMREFLTLAAAIQRESGDEVAEQRSLVKLASTLDAEESARAEAIFKKALIVFDKHDVFYERAVALRFLSDLQMEQKRFDEADKSALESLELYRKHGEPLDEIKTLRTLGILKRKQGQLPTARQFFEQALAKLKEHADADTEAQVFASLGELELSAGQSSLALANFQKASTLLEKSGAVSDFAEILILMGVTNLALGQNDAARQFAERALQIAEEHDIAEVKPTTANLLGLIYSSTGKYPAAIKILEYAVEHSQKVGNQQLAALSYYNLGRIYDILGDYKRSEANLLKAYQIQDKIGGTSEKHAALYSLGQTSLRSGNLADARKKFDELLESAKKNKDLIHEALARQMLGKVALRENNPLEAQTNFISALTRFSELKYPLGIALTTKDLGDSLVALKQFDQAQMIFGQALPIFRQIDSPTSESAVFESLMNNSRSAGKRRLAIFFGKQSVNLLQKLRGSLSVLESEIQKSFIASNESVYRALAAMLIEEGRLAEAQQVIALLKEDEYFQYTRRADTLTADTIPQVNLNAPETLAAEKYKTLSDKLSSLTGQITELNLKQNTTALSKEEQEKLANLQTDLVRLNAAFGIYLQETAVQFAEPPTASAASPATIKNWQKKLADWNDEAVLLTAMVTDDFVYLILTTSKEQISRRLNISASELEDKVKNFRSVLQDSRFDALPAAQDFYKTFFAPIAEDVRRSKAKTILLSLDGDLRYIPFAALHDGEKFLVEDYTTVFVTLAQISGNLISNPTNRRGLGAGVSKKIGDFPALPNAVKELQAIIREEKDQRDEGIFPGKILLDKDFTRKNLAESLQQNFNFVFIASHFVLEAGKDADSFLLLGNDEKLDLATFRTAPEFSLNGIELLTLSACDTGVSSADGNGVEIESFAVLAQKRGANSVVASLWQVADDSTADLMTDFYANYQKQNSDYTKAQILRDVQLKMLKSAGTKKFSHPYFWSPFIFIGQWK